VGRCRLRREILAEGLGTGLLLFLVVGSGISAGRLALDPGVALLAHAVAVGAGLAVLIVVFGPISGAHFNPVVTLSLWQARIIGPAAVLPYIAVQLLGGVVGVVVANISFDAGAVSVSDTDRISLGTGVSEVVVTFVLLLLILVLIRIERTSMVAPAVGAWVAAAIFGTSSGAFANPAVSISRMFTDTYTGINPASVPGFIASQFIGAALAVGATAVLRPTREEIR
jgi:glycerol uptake facilitator-like aquaporin